jgi:hypothetical protein
VESSSPTIESFFQRYFFRH